VERAQRLTGPPNAERPCVRVVPGEPRTAHRRPTAPIPSADGRRGGRPDVTAHGGRHAEWSRHPGRSVAATGVGGRGIGPRQPARAGRGRECSQRSHSWAAGGELGRTDHLRPHRASRTVLL